MSGQKRPAMHRQCSCTSSGPWRWRHSAQESHLRPSGADSGHRIPRLQACHSQTASPSTGMLRPKYRDNERWGAYGRTAQPACTRYGAQRRVSFRSDTPIVPCSMYPQLGRVCAELPRIQHCSVRAAGYQHANPRSVLEPQSPFPSRGSEPPLPRDSSTACRNSVRGEWEAADLANEPWTCTANLSCQLVHFPRGQE